MMGHRGYINIDQWYNLILFAMNSLGLEVIYGEFKPPRQPIHNKLAELGLLRGFRKQANHLWKKHPLQPELTKNGYHQEKIHLQ